MERRLTKPTAPGSLSHEATGEQSATARAFAWMSAALAGLREGTPAHYRAPLALRGVP